MWKKNSSTSVLEFNRSHIWHITSVMVKSVTIGNPIHNHNKSRRHSIKTIARQYFPAKSIENLPDRCHTAKHCIPSHQLLKHFNKWFYFLLFAVNHLLSGPKKWKLVFFLIQRNQRVTELNRKIIRKKINFIFCCAISMVHVVR